MKLPPGRCLIVPVFSLCNSVGEAGAGELLKGRLATSVSIWVTTIGNVNKNTSAETWPCPGYTCPGLFSLIWGLARETSKCLDWSPAKVADSGLKSFQSKYSSTLLPTSPSTLFSAKLIGNVLSLRCCRW